MSWDRESVFRWGHAALTADFDFGGTTPGLVRLARPTDPEPPVAAVPLVDLAVQGDGTGYAGPAFTGTAFASRLRHRAHHAAYGDGRHRLTVELQDPKGDLRVYAEYSSPDGVPVLRSRVRLRNTGGTPVTVRSASSLLLGTLPSPDTLDVHRARNDWLAECRWYDEELRASVPDFGREFHGRAGRAGIRLAGRGSWPTDGHLAMGGLTDRRNGRSWLWQIESAASWRWDLGETEGHTYLALYGPTADEHGWSQLLAPGEEFTTEPVALALGDGFDGALAALTSYRRAVRRPHHDHAHLPVIFNDYMNTLMGDPTTEKLLPLIDAAARAGAEYFCVDAGWYDDSPGWWDGVGAWQPSRRRFPGGIEEVLDRIRERGMVPGLWLEPEVIGVRSPLAESLPAEAFLSYGDGVRVKEQGRHQLDLRHPAARAHLDETVDRLVKELGVGYLKLDYNITTSVPGHLGHSRAWLAWLGSVLDRHPGLVVENCASGGMRMDGASLAVAQLQSTSDQQDFLRYAAIAAAAPTAVTPEQGAVWAYPQPEFTDDEIGFTLASALLGRVHLSGRLDRMTEDQLTLVREALTAYRALRADLPTAVPFWPSGLPGWTDEWLALGLRVATAGGATYVTVWRRGGEAERFLPVRHLHSAEQGPDGVRVSVVHPSAFDGTAEWDGDRDGGGVRVVLPRSPMAVVLRLSDD